MKLLGEFVFLMALVFGTVWLSEARTFSDKWYFITVLSGDFVSATTYYGGWDSRIDCIKFESKFIDSGASKYVTIIGCKLPSDPDFPLVGLKKGEAT